MTHQWRILVRLARKNFKDRLVPEDLTWATIVFVPKGRREYREIGLRQGGLEVLRDGGQLSSQEECDATQRTPGFREGRGTGNATLEAKLAQQLAGIVHELLFQVFLDLRKAYDSLDRGWCMEILREYRMGQNTARLIAHHLEISFLFQRQIGSYGCLSERGEESRRDTPRSP